MRFVPGGGKTKLAQTTDDHLRQRANGKELFGKREKQQHGRMKRR